MERTPLNRLPPIKRWVHVETSKWICREHICHDPGLRGQHIQRESIWLLTSAGRLYRDHQAGLELLSNLQRSEQFHQRPWQLASSISVNAITVVLSFGGCTQARWNDLLSFTSGSYLLESRTSKAPAMCIVTMFKTALSFLGKWCQECSEDSTW